MEIEIGEEVRNVVARRQPAARDLPRAEEVMRTRACSVERVNSLAMILLTDRS